MITLNKDQVPGYSIDPSTGYVTIHEFGNVIWYTQMKPEQFEQMPTTAPQEQTSKVTEETLLRALCIVQGRNTVPR